MEKITNNNFIIPFAKFTGITSFSSMNVIKKELGIKKVGHTGTLDSFADGLLVLVSGQYTRLAEIICGGKKTYDAWIEFGIQTDTLESTGGIILKKALPEFKELEKGISKFIGKYEQIPPQFSAIKIDGKRASDRIRAGEDIKLKPRLIEIFNIELIKIITEFDPKDKKEKVKFAHMRIDCSKGTYIRSLARDIGLELGSCAYLKALRRTAVGNFKLEDAVGFSALPDFSELCSLANSSKLLNSKKDNNLKIQTICKDEIIAKAVKFLPDIAKSLNLPSLDLNEKYLFGFKNGKKISLDWFNLSGFEIFNKIKVNSKIAIFNNNNFLGIISKQNNYLKYEFVLN